MNSYQLEHNRRHMLNWVRESGCRQILVRKLVQELGLRGGGCWRLASEILADQDLTPSDVDQMIGDMVAQVS